MKPPAAALLAVLCLSSLLMGQGVSPGPSADSSKPAAPAAAPATGAPADPAPAPPAEAPTLAKASDLFKKQLFEQAKKMLQYLVVLNPSEAEAFRLLSEIYGFQNDRKNQLQALDSYLAINPTAPEVEKAISISKSLGDRDKEAEYCEKVLTLKLAPQDAPLLRQALDALVNYYELKNKREDLYRVLARLTEAAPRNEQYHFKKGLIDFENKNFSAGYAEFDAVKKISPDFKKINFYLGECAFALEKYDAAALNLQRASLESDAGAEVFLHWGKSALALKRSREAADAYEGLLKKDPKNLDVINQLIEIYEKENNRLRLVALYETRQSVAGQKDPKTLLKLADITRTQNLIQAIALYEQVLGFEKENTVALTALVDLCEAKNERAKMAEYLSRLMAVQPSPRGNKKLCDLYLELKDTLKALEPLERYTAQSASDGRALLQLGELYLAAKQDEKAAAVLGRLAEDKSAQKGLNAGNLYYLYGNSLQRTGKRLDAVKAYESAIKSNPTLGDAWFYMASYYLEMENWQQAIDALLKVRTLGLNKDDATKGLAKAYFMSGGFEQAVPYLEEIMAGAPGNPQIAEKLALAHLKLKQPDKAGKYLQMLGVKAEEQFGDNFQAAVAFEKAGNDAASRKILLKVIDKNASDAEALRMLADLEKRNNQRKAAIGALEKLNGVKSNPDLQREIGDLYLADGDRNAAAAAYEQFLEVNKRDRKVLDTLLSIYVAQSNVEKTYSTLKLLSALAAQNEHYHFKLGRIEFDRRDFKSAQVSFEKVRQISPNFPDLPFFLGESYFAVQNFAKAEPLLAAASAANPKNGDLLAHLAQAYRAGKKSAQSAQAFELLLAQKPNDKEITGTLIEIYEGLGAPDNLIPLYQKWLSISGKEAGTLLKLARLYQKQKNTDKALDAYMDVISVEENNVAALAAVVELLEGKGDFKRASKYLNAWIAFNPAPELNLRLAGFYLKSGDTSLAVEPLERYTAVKRSDLTQLSLLGECYLAAKAYDKAEIIFERIVALKPAKGLGDFYLRYAQSLEGQEKTASAVAAYEKAVVFNPANGEALYKIGKFYLDQKQWSKAIAPLQKARTLKIRTDEVSAGLAEAYANSDALNAAVPFLEEMNAKNPGQALTLERLAKAYLAAKNSKNAVKVLDQLVSKGSDVFQASLPAALAFVAEQRDKQAEPILVNYLSANPGDAQALRILVEVYRRQKNARQAVERLEQLFQLKKDVQLKREVGELLADDAPDKAVAAFEEYASQAPQDRKVLEWLKSYYGKKKDDEKLYPILGKLSAVSPREEEYPVKMGEMDFAAKRYDNAVSAYLRVKTVNPKNQRLAVVLGESYYQLNKFKEAEGPLKEAVAHAPTDLRLRFFLAQTYERNGNRAAAASEYEKVLAGKPDDLELVDKLISFYEPVKNYERLAFLYQKRQDKTPAAERKPLLLKLAAIQRMQKRSKEAVDTYEKVLAIDNGDAAALAALADLYEEANDPKRAADRLGQLLANSPSPANNLRLALLFLSLKDSAKAVEPLERYTAAKPTPEELKLLGLCYMSQKMYDKAEVVLAKMVKSLTPANAASQRPILLSLYEIYSSRKDDVNLKSVLLKLVLADPKNAKFAYELGKMYYDEKAADPAIKYLAAAEQLQPGMENADRMLGNLYYAKKQYREALPFLKKAEGKDSKNVEIHRMLGTVYLQDPAGAKLAAEQFEKVLSLDANDMAAAEALMSIYEKQKATASLIPVYERMTVLNPQNGKVWEKLGVLALDLKDLSRAEKALLKTVELDPKNIGAYLRLGDLYESQKKGAAAIPHYLKAVDLGAKNTDQLQKKVGFLYLSKGDTAAAGDHLYKSIEANPAQPEVAFILGKISDQKKDLSGALSYYDMAAEAQPGNPDYLFHAGRASFRLSEYPSAKRKLLLAVAKNPKLEEAQFMLGQIALTQSDFKQAVQYFSAANRLAPDNLDYLKQLADANFKAKLYQEAMPAYRRLAASRPQDFEIRANLGRCLLYLKNGREALEAFNAVYIGKPQLIEDEFEIGALYFESKRPVEAKRILQNVLRIHPENGAAQEMLGTLYEAEKDLPHAIEHYEEAARGSKERAALLKKTGDLYLSLGRQDKAIAAYEAFLKTKKDLVTARALLDLYKAGGRKEEIRRMYVEISLLEPGDAANLMSLGKMDFDNGKSNEALTSLAKVVKINPNHFDALYLSGRIYLEQKNYKAALSDLSSAVRVNPGSTEASKALGELYAATGQADLAISSLSRVFKADPKNEALLDQLIGLFRAQKRGPELVAHLTMKTVLNPKAGDAYLELGRLYLDQKKDTDAEAALKKSLMVKGDNFEALSLLADLFSRLKRVEEAIEYYKKAVYIESKNPEIYFKLGHFYLGKKDSSSALDAFEKVVQYKPDHPEALEKLGDLYLAFRYQEKAVATFQKIVKAKPNNPAGYMALGRAHLDLKDYASAEDNLRKALQYAPGNAEAYYLLGQLYQKRGNADPAVSSFAQAYRLKPENADYGNAYADALYGKKDFAAALPVLLKLFSADKTDPRAAAAIMECYLSLGQTESAIRYVEILEKADPQKLNKNFKVAKAFFKLGKRDRALSILEGMAAPRDKDSKEYYRMLADMYTAKQQYGKAVDALRSLFDQDASDMKAGLDLGETYEKRAEQSLAVETYKKLEISFPRDEEVKRRLLRCYKQMGSDKYEEMRYALSQLIKLQPNNPDYLLEMAGFLYRDGQRGEAAEMLSRVLKASPKNAEACALYGKILLEKKDYSSAEKFLLNGASAKSTDVSLDLGNLYLETKVYAKARLYLEKSYKADPKNMPVAVALAQVYEKLNMDNQLFELYQSIVKADPTNAVAQRGIGDIYYGRKDFKNAMSYYGLALKLKSDDVPILNRQADLQLKANKIQEAVSLFRSSLQYSPNQPEIAFLLGTLLLENLGNEVAARTQFEQVVLMDPKNFKAYKMLGVIYEQGGDGYSAVRSYKEAYKIAPEDPEVVNALAKLLVKQGNSKEAEPVLKRAVEANPKDMEARLALGRLYLEVKRFSDAEPLFSAAYQAKPSDLNIMMSLLQTYNGMKAYGKVIPILEKLDKTGQSSNEMKMQLGIAYFGQGNAELAKKTLEALLTKVEGTPEALFILGQIYYGEKDFRRAKIVFKNVTDKDKSHLGANYFLGELARSERDYDLAAIHYEMVFSADQNHENVANNLVECYVSQENFHKARELITVGLRRDNKNGPLLFQYGKLLYLEGKFTDSQKYLKAAVSRLPQSDEPGFYMAMTMVGLKQSKAALQEASAGLKKYPRSDKMYYALASALLLSQQADKALQSLQHAITLNPSFRDAYKKRGDVYAQIKKDSAAAVANYKRYVSLGGSPQDIPSEYQGKIQ